MTKEEREIVRLRKDNTRLREMMRSVCDNAKVLTLRLDIGRNDDGGYSMQITSSATPDVERLQAKIISGVFCALIADARLSEIEDEAEQYEKGTER